MNPEYNQSIFDLSINRTAVGKFPGPLQEKPEHSFCFLDFQRTVPAPG
jgi:hypothetical protein